MDKKKREELEARINELKTQIDELKQKNSVLADVLEQLLSIARGYLDQNDLNNYEKIIAIIRKLIQELLNILHRGIQSPTNDPRISEDSEKRGSNSGGRR